MNWKKLIGWAMVMLAMLGLYLAEETYRSYLGTYTFSFLNPEVIFLTTSVILLILGIISIKKSK